MLQTNEEKNSPKYSDERYFVLCVRVLDFYGFRGQIFSEANWPSLAWPWVMRKGPATEIEKKNNWINSILSFFFSLLMANWTNKQCGFNHSVFSLSPRRSPRTFTIAKATNQIYCLLNQVLFLSVPFRLSSFQSLAFESLSIWCAFLAFNSFAVRHKVSKLCGRAV